MFSSQIISTTKKHTEEKRKGVPPINATGDKVYLSYVPPGRKPTKGPKIFKIKKTITNVGKYSPNLISLFSSVAATKGNHP